MFLNGFRKYSIILSSENLFKHNSHVFQVLTHSATTTTYTTTADATTTDDATTTAGATATAGTTTTADATTTAPPNMSTFLGRIYGFIKAFLNIRSFFFGSMNKSIKKDGMFN